MKIDEPSFHSNSMARAKATIILIILCTVPFNPILGVAVAQDTSQGIADITLEYSDEKYTAIRDPTLLPPSLPAYRTQNFYSETFGETFVNYNRLYSESGDVIEVGGVTDYGLVDLSKSYALLSNSSMYSLESGDYIQLTEPVVWGDNYSWEMWYSCDTKWVFSDTCWDDRRTDLVLDRFLVIRGDHWSEDDVIFDIRYNGTIFTGEIDSWWNIDMGDYAFVETRNFVGETEQIEVSRLRLLNLDGDFTIIDEYGDRQSYEDACFSEKYIRVTYRDYDNGSFTAYRLISTNNGSFIEYQYEYQQCFPGGGYVLVQGANSSDWIPYSLDELLDLEVHGIENDFEQFRGQLNCGTSYEGIHRPNQFHWEYSHRFFRCDVVNNTASSFYFDTMTGKLIETYKDHRPRFSNENVILFGNSYNDCLLWDTESNTLVPIIELSSFSCSEAFLYNDRLFLSGGLAVVEYSSDGRIDLDDGVASKDVAVLETLNSGIEDLAESNIFSILLSVLLFLMFVKSRRDSNRNINQLRGELTEEYASIESEHVAYVQEERTLPNQDLDGELIRAINLFPDWSRAQIQEHLDNGWSVDQLVEWREGQNSD